MVYCLNVQLQCRFHVEGNRTVLALVNLWKMAQESRGGGGGNLGISGGDVPLGPWNP